LSKTEVGALKERVAKKAGKRPWRLSPEQRIQIARDYIAEPGITFSELARRYGIAVNCARYHVHKQLIGVK